MRSEQDLVAGAQRGEQANLNELLERHYDRIHAVCCRIAGTTRDGEDATQEALIRIVRYLDRFDGRSAFGTWAYRIATNTAIDEIRKRNRRPQLHVVQDDNQPTEPTDPVAHRVVEGSIDRLVIDQAIAQLPDDFRIPVVMRDVGDLDYAEIAAELNIPIGTVKSRIARGRRMIADQLRDPDDIVGNHDLGDRRPTPRPPTDP